MSKNSNSVSNAEKVYRHALHFLATDGFLRTHAENDPSVRFWCQYPGMVILTFASELLLKCLLILEGKDPPREHNLETLFNSLDDNHKKEIEVLWDADQVGRKDSIDEQQNQMGVDIPRDLTTALSDCQDAFVEFRYLYEDPTKARFYITFFPQHVRHVIREMTGWTD